MAAQMKGARIMTLGLLSVHEGLITESFHREVTHPAAARRAQQEEALRAARAAVTTPAVGTAWASLARLWRGLRRVVPAPRGGAASPSRA